MPILKKLKCLLIIPCLLLTSCGHLFYYPDDRLYVDFKKLEIEPKQIELQTSDNKKFYGWYFKASDKPKGKILFFHGNGQNRSAHFFALYWILKENYDFFIFDYPEYGGSEGTASQESTTDSGTKALEWLSQQNPSVPLIIFGQSLGGNIAIYTMTKNKAKITPCMVVVDSTFKSYRKVAQRTAAKSWLLWPLQGVAYTLVRDQYSAADHMEEISPVPLDVFHGDQDPIVGIENGQDVFLAAKEPKKFYLVPGPGHIQAFVGSNKEKFRAALLEDLAKNCPVKN